MPRLKIKDRFAKRYKNKDLILTNW